MADLLQSFNLSQVKSFQAYRCEAFSVGIETRRDPRTYNWDNSKRETFSLFQYTLEGEGIFRDGDRDVRLSAGDAFLVNCPSDTGYRLGPGGEWTFVYLLVLGDMARHHVSELVARHGHILPLAQSSPPVEILMMLHRECTAGMTHDKYSLTATVYRFLMELYRSLEPRDDIPACVGRAVRRIEHSYGNPALRVSDLAREAGLSVFHFSRLFHRHTGMSPYAYLMQVRMNRAMDHLLSTQLSVKEVSRMTGFNDVSYFCRAFRHRNGMSPGQTRS